MLLKGMHDNVKISIVEPQSVDDEAKTEKVEAVEPQEAATNELTNMEPAAPKPDPIIKKKQSPAPKTGKNNSDEHEASLRRQSPQKFTFDSFRGTPTSSPVMSRRKCNNGSANKNIYSSPLRTAAGTSSPLQTRSPFTIRQTLDPSLSPFRTSPQRTSPSVPRRKQDIAGASSDGEAEVFTRTRSYLSPPPIGVCSDSEVDGRVSVTPRRGRVKLPPVFLAQQSMSSLDTSGRPPAPWRMRKAQSSMNVTKSPDVVSRRKSMGAVQTNTPIAKKKESVVVEEQENVQQPDSKRHAGREPSIELPTLDHENYTVPGEEPDSPPNTKENDGPPPPTRPTRAAPLKQKSYLLSREASMRVDNEVHQLMKDICRVGSNPGEPSVTFGELFDDETVQDTYEALVGTLRSAKRQGYIDFKGQMLFKGMHDDVTINVVEKTRPAEAVV